MNYGLHFDFSVMPVHERIAVIVKLRGLTQESLMPALGVRTRGAVGHYLTGRRNMSTDQFFALARLIGVTGDFLFYGK